MAIKVTYHSYKFGKEILESKGTSLEQLEQVIFRTTSTLSDLTRPNLNDRMESYLVNDNWSGFLKDKKEIEIEYYKDKVGMKIRTGHPSFMGSDLLEFELANVKENLIDVGIYIVVTSHFRKKMIETYKVKWEGSLTFDKAVKEIERYKSVIHTPIVIVGIDME